MPLIIYIRSNATWKRRPVRFSLGSEWVKLDGLKLRKWTVMYETGLSAKGFKVNGPEIQKWRVSRAQTE